MNSLLQRGELSLGSERQRFGQPLVKVGEHAILSLLFHICAFNVNWNMKTAYEDRYILKQEIWL